jgi:hypothetical protein
MQISTVHKIQAVLDSSTKVLKYIWRHVFVLAVFGLLIAAYLIYPAIDWPMFFTELFIAMGLDKFKMKFKPINNGFNPHEQMFESSIRNSEDFSWKMNPLNPMCYTYHTYNSGNNYN